MSSAALALTRNVWWPYRRGLAVCAVAWLVLAALGLLLPRGAWAPATPQDDPIAPVAAVVSDCSCWHSSLCSTHFPPSRRGAHRRTEHGFPDADIHAPRMYGDLGRRADVPGGGDTAVVWVAWAGAVLRPAGMKVDLVWPAVLTAALVAWLQALVWWPFPFRFLRVVVAAPVIAATIALAPAFALALETPPVAVAAGAGRAPSGGLRRRRRWSRPGAPRRRADMDLAVTARRRVCLVAAQPPGALLLPAPGADLV